jgi:hypothetical protein
MARQLKDQVQWRFHEPYKSTTYASIELNVEWRSAVMDDLTEYASAAVFRWASALG